MTDKESIKIEKYLLDGYIILCHLIGLTAS